MSATRIDRGQVDPVALLTSRRAILGALAVAAVPLIRRAAPTVAQEATPAALAAFAGETFVGETSDPETLVAIVLGEEAGDAPRQARAYLCNGLARTIDVWLTGEAVADRLELTAEDGSRLTGALNEAGVGGGATLADGRSLVFTALPATGLAGLYTVTMLPEGRMEGGSAAGAELVGVLADEVAPAGEAYRYDVAVTTPEGVTAEITIRTGVAEEGAFRTIILPNGRGKGQGKTKRTGDWVDPDIDP